MSTTSFLSENRRYKFGWLILCITSALLILNNLYLVFYEGEPVWAIGHLGFSLLATPIIYIPYRRGERWAWYTLWILPGTLLFIAILEFTNGQPMLGWYYTVLTMVVITGLLLSIQAFLAKVK